MCDKNKKGMIALFPALVISSVLLISSVGASLSFISFLYRTVLFDQKHQTQVSAKACIMRLLAKREVDANYHKSEAVHIGQDVCEIIFVTPNKGSVEVRIGDAATKEQFEF